MKRNPHFEALKSLYLFPLIHRKKLEFLKANPEADVISLGIGDTTEPIPRSIVDSMMQAADSLGTPSGYVGYGPEQGMSELREKIALHIYHNNINPADIFISDGAKCDIGRLQMLFGQNISVALQDPVYPVYLDGSVMQGVKQIVSLPSIPENNFFPEFSKIPQTDLIYFCSPNNPTGATATRKELQTLVDFALANRSIILFDSAYSFYIQDPDLPKSIYEIENAKKVAIEVSSFSKLIGFTGVRLGWTVIPNELLYENGESIKADWHRLTSTIFNGASNISQRGGCAVLSEHGLQEVNKMTRFYMENATILREELLSLGFQVYGGQHAPYLWVRFKEMSSWDAFQMILDQCHLVTTPGSGYGSHGEGFIRFSAFGHRENILKAAERLRNLRS